MVLQDQEILHYSLEVRKDPYSHQVSLQPLEYLMDVPYPNRIILGSFLYKLIDEQKSHLLNARSASQDKALFFQDLSS